MLGIALTSLTMLGWSCEDEERDPPDLTDPEFVIPPHPNEPIRSDLELIVGGPEKVCVGQDAKVVWSVDSKGTRYVYVKSVPCDPDSSGCVVMGSSPEGASTPVFEVSTTAPRHGDFGFRCLKEGKSEVGIDLILCKAANENCAEISRIKKTFTVNCVSCDDDPMQGGGIVSKLTEKVVPDEEKAKKVAEGEKPNPSPEECTSLSDDSDCKKPEGPQRIALVLDPILELSDAAAERIFGETLSCGAHDDYHVLCGPGTPSAGSWVYLFARFDADIPLSGSQILQYAFVFDADDDPDNGWEPLPEYPKDFFAGTDLWYEALYAPNTGWSLQVRDARADLASYPSAARLVIAGPEFGILVPLSEFDTETPKFRTTAFAHEGDYGLSGGFWSGDYLPTLEEPLLPVATDLVIPVEE